MGDNDVFGHLGAEGGEGFGLAVKVEDVIGDGITADRKAAREGIYFWVGAPNENSIVF